MEPMEASDLKNSKALSVKGGEEAMSETLGGSAREVAMRNRQRKGTTAPPRGDAGSLLHGPPRGHSTRGMSERIAYFQQQKAEVQRRQEAQRQANTVVAGLREVNQQINSLQGQLRSLQRQKAVLESRTRHGEPTFG